MRSFGTVKQTFWTGPTGRAIRAEGKDAQLLAVYVMTCPHANMLGCYYLPLVLIKKELAMTMPEVVKAMAALEKCEFATYDAESEVIWVYNMAAYQVGDEVSEFDKRLPAIRRAYRDLHDCPFLGPFFDRYAETLHLDRRREGSTEKLHGLAAMLQGHAEGQEAPGLGSVSVPVPVLVGEESEKGGAVSVRPAREAQRDRFERFWRVYPKRKAKDDAWRAWQKRNPDDLLTQTILEAVERQCRGPDWIKDGGKYIPHPATWLNQGRWQDEDVAIPQVSEDTIDAIRGGLQFAAGE